MKMKSVFSFGFAAAMAFAAFADANNTLITFSTLGSDRPDLYADGTIVKDGEWYALAWTKNDTFGGLGSDGAPLVEGDRILLAAPLAKKGHCPWVVFQLDSQFVKKEGLDKGNYIVVLLDTRGVDAKQSPSPRVEGQKMPALVNGVVETAAKAPASGTSQRISGNVSGRKWNESEVADLGLTPKVTDIRVIGNRVQGWVSDLQPTVRYNVYRGKDVDKIDEVALDRPFVCPENGGSIFFDLEADEGSLIQVRRHSISGK